MGINDTILNVLDELKKRVGADIPEFDYLFQPRINEQLELFTTQQQRIETRLQELVKTILKINSNYNGQYCANTHWPALVCESYYGLFKIISVLQKLVMDSTKQIMEVEDQFLPQKPKLIATQNAINQTLIHAIGLIDQCYATIFSQCLTDKHWEICNAIPSALYQITHESDYLGNLCAAYYIPIEVYGDLNQKIDLYLAIVETIASNGDSRGIEIAVLKEMKSPSRIAGIPINNPNDVETCIKDLLKKDNLTITPNAPKIDISVLPKDIKYEDGILKIPIDVADTMDIKTWGQRTEQLIDLIPDARLSAYHEQAAKAFGKPIQEIKYRAIAEGNKLWLIYQIK